MKRFAKFLSMLLVAVMSVTLVACEMNTSSKKPYESVYAAAEVLGKAGYVVSFIGDCKLNEEYESGENFSEHGIVSVLEAGVESSDNDKDQMLIAYYFETQAKVEEGYSLLYDYYLETILAYDGQSPFCEPKTKGLCVYLGTSTIVSVFESGAPGSVPEYEPEPEPNPNPNPNPNPTEIPIP